MSFVLDSSAVLAAILDEAGADQVLDRLTDGHFSAVNLSEALAKLGERGLAIDAAQRQISRLDLQMHAFDPEMAQRTAALRPVTRQFGMSLGDRACLALAQALGLPVVTSDRQMAEAGRALGMDLHAIR